jgi:peptidoglycan hydrolase CwlO-like protein
VYGVKDGDELQSVNYDGLIPVLINEIKNLKNEIKTNNEEIKTLKEDILTIEQLF